MKQMLEIGRIWDEDSFFELAVTASNGTFAGSVQFYSTTDELHAFASAVKGFPLSSTDERRFEFGPDHHGSRFALHLECADSAGHARAIITIHDATGPWPQQVTLTLGVVASDIDRFNEDLERLCRDPAAVVRLGSGTP
jgi:hypothetical protein